MQYSSLNVIEHGDTTTLYTQKQNKKVRFSTIDSNLNFRRTQKLAKEENLNFLLSTYVMVEAEVSRCRRHEPNWVVRREVPDKRDFVESDWRETPLTLWERLTRHHWHDTSLAWWEWRSGIVAGVRYITYWRNNDDDEVVLHAKFSLTEN